MKKIIAIAIGIFMVCGVANAAGVVGNNKGIRSNVTSSGVLTADGVVKSTGGIVYGITGQAAAADVRVILVDGAIGDSETAGSQLLDIGVGVDNDPINVIIPNGIRFPNGIYYNEKTGNATVTIIYE